MPKLQAPTGIKTTHTSRITSRIFWRVLHTILRCSTFTDGLVRNILTYLRHSITNAVTEGLNSKIQSIKSNARGFRSFKNYRTRILYFCGKLELQP